MGKRGSCYFAAACLFCCFATSARAALDGVADSVQAPTDILFNGSAFLIVEGESTAEITGDPATRFLIVDNVNPIQTITMTSGGFPVEKGGLDVLPANTNASGGAALFDNLGGASHASTSTYEIQFANPGTYYLYVHASIYNSDTNFTYGNEDSFFLPPAFNKNSSTDWIGFEGIDYLTGDPKIGDSAVDGWEPVFNNKLVMSAGDTEVHNDTNEDFWDGQFHWMHAAFVIDSNAAGGYIKDEGFTVRYIVTEDDVDEVLTFQISNREHYGVIDQFVFTTSNTLLQEFTQRQVGQLFNPIVGDMDADDDVDFDDIDDFVLGLNDPAEYETIFGLPPSVNGDTDGDRDQDFDDIPGFVAILTGSEANSIPEPATWALAALAGIALAFAKVRGKR